MSNRLSISKKIAGILLINSGIAMANASCPDPVAVVLGTLDCIKNEDAHCAYEGYAKNFVKLHNTIDTKTYISGPEFWEGAFMTANFRFSIDHVAQVGEDQVSIRYVETVISPLKVAAKQHEHALVTVNDDCQMTLWDQYGDNTEQLGSHISLP